MGSHSENLTPGKAFAADSCVFFVFRIESLPVLWYNLELTFIKNINKKIARNLFEM